MLRFRYSLRTLLIVVTLLALPCWWMGWQAKIVRERQAMLAGIRALGGISIVDPDLEPLLEVPWYRDWLGDYAIHYIVVPTEVLPSIKTEVSAIFPEARLESFRRKLKASELFR